MCHLKTRVISAQNNSVGEWYGVHDPRAFCQGAATVDYSFPGGVILGIVGAILAVLTFQGGTRQSGGCPLN